MYLFFLLAINGDEGTRHCTTCRGRGVPQGDRAVYLDVGTSPVDVHTSKIVAKKSVYITQATHIGAVRTIVETLESTRGSPIILDTGVPGIHYFGCLSSQTLPSYINTPRQNQIPPRLPTPLLVLL